VSAERACPVCGWQLFSDELWILSESEAEDHARRLEQAQRLWQEAVARFQRGEFGTGASAIPTFRAYLERIGEVLKRLRSHFKR